MILYKKTFFGTILQFSYKPPRLARSFGTDTHRSCYFTIRISILTNSTRDWVTPIGREISSKFAGDFCGCNDCPHGVSVTQWLTNSYYVRYDLKHFNKL